MSLESHELDARVKTIVADTSRRLEAVPYTYRTGDWEALATRHREMVAILREGRVALGRLEPAPAHAAAYDAYLQAVDRHLADEARVLEEAEAADLAAYSEANRRLVATARELQLAARRAGLSAYRQTVAERVRIWLVYPWVSLKAQARLWREQGDGRSWDAEPRPIAMPSAWLLLMTLVATVIVDWALKALARSQYPGSVSFQPVVSPGVDVIVVVFFLLTLRATAARPRTPLWSYGAGLLWGGLVSTLMEYEVRGGATHYFRIGDHAMDLAELAFLTGGAMWSVALVHNAFVAVQGYRATTS